MEGPFGTIARTSTTYRASKSYFGAVSCHETPGSLHGGTIRARSTSSGGKLLRSWHDTGEKYEHPQARPLHGGTIRVQRTNLAGKFMRGGAIRAE